MYGLPAKSPSIVARYKTFAKAIEAFKRYVKTFICLWQNTYFHLSFQNVVCLQVLLTQFPDDSVSWHYPGLRASGSGLTRSHMEKVKMVRTRSAKECMNTMYQQSSVCSTNCKCPFYKVLKTRRPLTDGYMAAMQFRSKFMCTPGPLLF